MLANSKAGPAEEWAGTVGSVWQKKKISSQTVAINPVGPTPPPTRPPKMVTSLQDRADVGQMGHDKQWARVTWSPLVRGGSMSGVGCCPMAPNSLGSIALYSHSECVWPLRLEPSLARFPVVLIPRFRSSFCLKLKCPQFKILDYTSSSQNQLDSYRIFKINCLYTILNKIRSDILIEMDYKFSNWINYFN